MRSNNDANGRCLEVLIDIRDQLAQLIELTRRIGDCIDTTPNYYVTEGGRKLLDKNS